MIPVDVRLALPSDAETLFRIKREASLSAFAHIFPPGRHEYPDDEVRDEVAAWLADAETETLVGQLRGKTVGFVTYGPGRLDSLFVLPDVHGSGVGSALHDTALAAQADLGADVCRLWVLAGNGPARTFYERRGWEPDGRERRAAYPPHPPELGYAVPVGASLGTPEARR